MQILVLFIHCRRRFSIAAGDAYSCYIHHTRVLVIFILYAFLLYSSSVAILIHLRIATGDVGSCYIHPPRILVFILRRHFDSFAHRRL